MAEEEEDGPRSRSPLDDYDPLKDDAPLMYEPDDTPEDHSDNTGEVDDEDFGASSGVAYSVTPPASVRQLRREKERSLTGAKAKQLSYKEYRQFVDRKKSQPRALINIIKEEHGKDPYLGKLSGTDSEDNVDQENSQDRRERKRKTDKLKKQMTKSRGFDRISKRLSEGQIPLESMEGAALSLSMPPPTLKVDSPSRSLSMSLKLPGPFGGGVQRPRREAPKQVECPRDRYEFHRLFSTLINLGSQAKKDKDRKPAKRQMSTEQELWQNKIIDALWLEIHAWYNSVSAQEQDKSFAQEREKSNIVLEEIMNFRINYSRDASSPEGHLPSGMFRSESQDRASSPSSPVVMGMHHELGCGMETDRLSTPLSSGGEQSPEPASPDSHKLGARTSPSLENAGETPFVWTGVSASFHSVTLTSETVRQQKKAMVCVQDMLERLDLCEHLYPTTKAFARTNALYGSKKFTQRIKSLCLWLNITRDLCHKIKLLGRVVGVHNMRGVDWPLTDFETPRVDDACLLPRPSIPDITQTVATSEEEVESDTCESGKTTPGKQVKFLTNSDGEKSRSASPVVFTEVPGGSSTPLRSCPSYGSYCTTLSRASSEMSLEEASKTSVYRHFVDKSLKKMGMNRLLKRLRDLLDNSLQRAKEALEKPHLLASSSPEGSPGGEDEPNLEEMAAEKLSCSPSLDFLAESHCDLSRLRHTISRLSSRTEYGAWSSEFINMGLPSFRPSYLFLVRIPLDVIHECLRFRLEQKPANEPSFLSIRQLIMECKEVLKSATKVKQYYQHMVAAVMWDDEDLEERFSSELEAFDKSVTEMLEVYFGYLQSWMQMLQSLVEASRSLQDALEEEWSFTKQICPHIIGGEAEAGKKFSTLASSLLSSISDFLESGIDEYTTSLYDLTSREEDQDESDAAESDEDEKDPKQEVIELRHSIQRACRNFKNLFHEARERASKALGFAKMLRKDLEIAADFNIAVPTKDLLNTLQDTDHAQIVVPLSAGYLMFIPKRIMQDRQQILWLLNVTCGREDNSKSEVSAKSEGYLLLVRSEGGADCVAEYPQWQGPVVSVETTAETAIALSHIAVEALFLVVTHSSHLATQRESFSTLMGATVDLVNEQTSCHQAIAESLDELKANAIDLHERIISAIKQVDCKLNLDDIHNLEEYERIHILKLYRETMLQCYNFGFEYHKEMMRLVSAEQRQNLGKDLVNFAKDWISFVCQTCERGRGMRPRWATHGFEFLAVVCDPKVLAILSETEFQALKQSINDCITHVIGSVDRSVPWSPTHSGKGLPKPGSQPVLRLTSWPEQSKVHRSMSTRSVHGDSTALSVPSTPSPEIRLRRSLPDATSVCSLQEGDDGGLVLHIHHRRHRAQSGDVSVQLPLSRRDRIRLGVTKLEESVYQRLHSSRVIGQLTNRRSETDFHINVRRVNFRWQRGIKIGEGQFGKVYTAVNIDTGVLMAMKEMKIQPTDHQDYKMIADEIKNFEGIRHENLVQYFGVEIHKDEMLIFMEYCDRGTIEEAAKLGLPENMIRRYTREILIAVNVIHEHNIIHRDLKGANIFITSSGKVKVGDFGCSLKLKTNTMPGDIHLVGTTAFMAPEVITQNNQQGHGRSADVWSIGCVVIEMTTGKRPWHDAENNYQIMFKVGMGGIPPIPDTLSLEGKDFLSHCFQHDPSQRYTASQLLDHPFTKVYEEDEREKEKLS